ncbi:MAG: Asp-tRNA(Asn)/Glu-tRNA(Gln) amidotransferase subunit GatC [Patescibacteria group bacterium]
MEIQNIENLANLCRIKLSESEKQELLNEMGSILNFIEQIQQVKTEDLKNEAGELRNVMRDDEALNKGGEFTDAILAEAPNREGQYIKVKKIL